MSSKKDKPSLPRLSSGLYLVATPIGNLGDMSERAIEILSHADIVACEDTRVTGGLFRIFNLNKPRMIVYNDHNADGTRQEIIKALGKGKAVALTSDAGMPLISDPGYKLVRECVEKDIKVTSVPGPSAPLTALQLSGLPSDRFSFIGFLPTKQKARQDLLKQWSEVPGTLIMFETASRLEKSLPDILEITGDRDAAVARELTKLYEEVKRGKVSELIEYYRIKGPPKGELVIVLGPPAEDNRSDNWEEELVKAMKTMSVRDAVAFIAENNKVAKKKVYAKALELSK